MELPSNPEEPTSVIRIMKDFDEFTKSGKSRRSQLSTRSNLGRVSVLDSLTFDLDESNVKPPREKEISKDKEVQLLTAKAKVINLEKQLKTFETDRKRVRIEYEREMLEKQRKVMKVEENYQELHKEIDYVLEKEKTAREEVTNLKKKIETLNDKYNKDVDEVRKENMKYKKEIEEFKEYHRREANALLDRTNENEVIYYKNKMEDFKAQLELLQSKLSRHADVMKENEKLSERMRQAEHKWKSAEEKILQQEEAFVVAKTMQNQLVKLNELRRQNDKYKEENKLLKDTRDNAVLLQEKYDAMKGKYDASVEKINSLSVIEVENEELKKKIKRWEIEDPSGAKKAMSPLELTRMISDLQKSQLSMMEKQGDLQASVAIKDKALQNVTQKHNDLKDQFLELKEKERQENEKCQRLQRRLLLVTADRDGIRRILNNYDTEISPNHSQQLQARVQEAEDRLTAANDLINTMETESDELKKEMKSDRLLLVKLQAEVSDLKSRPVATDKDYPDVNVLKNQIAALKKENDSLREKVDILELRIEKRHLQGDFDPTKTKVVHFAGNPVALSLKLHNQELENLRDENEDLRRRIKVLEQGTENQPAQLGNAHGSGVKAIQELKTELKSANLQNQRLKEVFANSVQDFRESCYQLFGYKNDMIGTKRFQLRSMYAEQENDYFIFQMTKEHQMEMIETEFSLQWKEVMKDYLSRGQSIPAFLSSVTLSLFSKQTGIIDTSLAHRV